MTELLRELEAVVGMAEKATPGEWRTDYRKTTRGYAQEVFDADGATIATMAWHAVPLNDTTTTTDREANAQLISALNNLFRTHHAEIAEALNDATLLRYLVRENNKGGRGAFRIVWFDEGDDGFTTTDGVSVDGKDELAIIRIVSAAMHNSAREDGE